MAKKQTELPGTRRDDEPEPQKPIKALDEACEALEKARGKATRAGQAVVEAKKAAQALLLEHKLDHYEYEHNDVLKKLFNKQQVGTCKVKVEKKRDDDTDDGEDEN